MNTYTTEAEILRHIDIVKIRLRRAAKALAEDAERDKPLSAFTDQVEVSRLVRDWGCWLLALDKCRDRKITRTA